MGKTKKNKLIFINILMIIIFSNQICNGNSKYFYLKRPVSNDIPLIKKFGLFLKSDSQPVMNFNYQFGFEKCIKIEEGIKAMEKGVVQEVWVDTKIDGYPNKWKKIFTEDENTNSKHKDGGLIIDYGIHEFIDGKIGRVYVKFSNITPIVKKGDKVNADTIVAKFSTCERYGYPPILTIQIALVDENNKLISYLGIISDK